jgi:anti-sigma regulatory factor (Ser/Thr protein kinase)
LNQKTHHSSRLFEADAGSAAYVREYVRDSLETWNLRSEEAVFLANELATNAIVHAHSEFIVEMSTDDEVCRIEVLDRDTQRPKIRARNFDSSHGRGLELVNAMSRSWGIERRTAGKTVWCDISVDPAS